MNTDNEDLKKLFNMILGTGVNIKDNINESEEIVFKSFIKKLENSYTIENKTFVMNTMKFTKTMEKDMQEILKKNNEFKINEENKLEFNKK